MRFNPRCQDLLEMFFWLLALAALIYLANVKGC
jgi:hypothetical protein